MCIMFDKFFRYGPTPTYASVVPDTMTIVAESSPVTSYF